MFPKLRLIKKLGHDRLLASTPLGILRQNEEKHALKTDNIILHFSRNKGAQNAISVRSELCVSCYIHVGSDAAL